MASLTTDASAGSRDRLELSAGVGGCLTILWRRLELPGFAPAPPTESQRASARAATDELRCGVGGCMDLYRYSIGCPALRNERPGGDRTPAVKSGGQHQE